LGNNIYVEKVYPKSNPSGFFPKSNIKTLRFFKVFIELISPKLMLD